MSRRWIPGLFDARGVLVRGVGSLVVLSALLVGAAGLVLGAAGLPRPAVAILAAILFVALLVAFDVGGAR